MTVSEVQLTTLDCFEILFRHRYNRQCSRILQPSVVRTSMADTLIRMIKPLVVDTDIGLNNARSKCERERESKSEALSLIQKSTGKMIFPGKFTYKSKFGILKLYLSPKGNKRLSILRLLFPHHQLPEALHSISSEIFFLITFHLFDSSKIKITRGH